MIQNESGKKAIQFVLEQLKAERPVRIRNDWGRMTLCHPQGHYFIYVDNQRLGMGPKNVEAHLWDWYGAEPVGVSADVMETSPVTVVAPPGAGVKEIGGRIFVGPVDVIAGL